MVGARDYEPLDWPRTDERGTGGSFWFLVENEDYIPVEEPDSVTRGYLFSVNGERDAVEADAMYRLIPRLNETGLEPSAVQALSDWCAEMWPLSDWQMRATDSDGDSLHDYWEGLHYGTLAWGPYDDLNVSGMNNRDAYLYGTFSNRMDSSPRMNLTREGDEMAFVYERPTFMDGSQFMIDYSINLVAWQTERIHTISTNAIDELYESVTELHPLSTEKTMFFRLKRMDDDPEPPSVKFTALSDGDDLNITAHVTGFSPEDIKLVCLRVDGVSHSTDCEAPYTFNVTGLGEGSHSLLLWLQDTSDAWLGSGTINITVVP